MAHDLTTSLSLLNLLKGYGGEYLTFNNAMRYLQQSQPSFFIPREDTKDLPGKHPVCVGQIRLGGVNSFEELQEGHILTLPFPVTRSIDIVHDEERD